MKLILEFDDLNPHPSVDCLPIIRKLINKYSNIVLNFFTVPYYEGVYLYNNKEWLKEIKDYIDSGNVNLAVHGTKHTFREYAFKTYPQAIQSLSESFRVFDVADLPVSKVFRGPYWGLCEDSIRALISLGFTHLYSHKDYEQLNNKYADQIKIAYYNWNLKDDWPHLENPLTSDIVVAHGHTPDVCGNGIEESFDRICKMLDINNIEFLKVDDY